MFGNLIWNSNFQNCLFKQCIYFQIKGNIYVNRNRVSIRPDPLPFVHKNAQYISFILIFIIHKQLIEPIVISIRNCK